MLRRIGRSGLSAWRPAKWPRASHLVVPGRSCGTERFDACAVSVAQALEGDADPGRSLVARFAQPAHSSARDHRAVGEGQLDIERGSDGKPAPRRDEETSLREGAG